MRVSSETKYKNSNNKQKYNRSTKTKASATKPQLFNIGLTRNKNNANPLLFGSAKKQKNCSKFDSHHTQKDSLYRSQTKQKKQTSVKILQDLNTKVSIDYINSIYSDIGIQLTYKLKKNLQNKENQFNENNENNLNKENICIKLFEAQQKSCLQKLKGLIKIKQNVNKSYKKMQNSRNLYSYLLGKQKESYGCAQFLKTKNINTYFKKDIVQFIKKFEQKRIQLEKLESQYQNVEEADQQVQQEKCIDEQNLDNQIVMLKQRIANQKRICLRYQKQQKFLMNKLYQTQIKNNDLKNSSSNLKIKNINLRDTSKLNFNLLSSLQLNLKAQSPKLKRSISMKLQRVKRFDFQENTIQKKKPLLMRSKSSSSLNSARLLANLPLKLKDKLSNKDLQ